MTADELWERVQAFARERMASNEPVLTLEKGVRNYITSVEPNAIRRKSDEGTTNMSRVTRGTVAKLWAELQGGPVANVLYFTRALVAAAAPDVVQFENGSLKLLGPTPRTFILTWNPERWSWAGLDADLARALRGERVELHRSTGNTKKIVSGDRIFLLKQGQQPRGIMASGQAVSAVTEEPHYDETRANEGDLANYVDVEIDRLVAPDAVMVVEDTREGPLADVHWAMPASGIELPAAASDALAQMWRAYTPPRSPMSSPDELTPGAQYAEGATLVVTVNRYERDPTARAACIARWGTRCAVCEFSFVDRYGDIGDGYVHVHHLVPLASGDGERLVDPVTDLRPVCPNCHSMLHRREPPLAIEELRARLR